VTPKHNLLEPVKRFFQPGTTRQSSNQFRRRVSEISGAFFPSSGKYGGGRQLSVLFTSHLLFSIALFIVVPAVQLKKKNSHEEKWLGCVVEKKW
jgi:hypothetical protein